MIITGASSGIGARTAVAAAREGARLALFARRKEMLEAVAKDCRDAGAKDCRVLAGDTTSREDIARALEGIADWKGVDLAFLNAGSGMNVTADQFTAEKVESVMRLNYSGVLYWMEPLMAEMIRRREGTIAVTGSVAADRGLARNGPYCASKAAVRTLMDSLRADAARFGVRLVLVEPGFVKSELTGRNAFRMPFILETDDAAARILDGFAAGRKIIRFPLPISLSSRLAGVLPTALYDRVAIKMLQKMVKHD